MISAEMVADSISPQGHRLSTMKVVMPRYILAEFNTHRVFSRNSASSRAIRFEKMVKMIQENPFVPIAWMKDHPGMQGTKYFTDFTEGLYIYPDNRAIKPITGLAAFREVWLAARDGAIKQAQWFSQIGLTKQICNRLLEPFMWHTVLVSSTEWENFFKLRCPQYVYYDGTQKMIFRSEKDLSKVPSLHRPWTIIEKLHNNEGQADIHMMALAEAMWDCMNGSKPKELQPGEWHIPFGDQIPHESLYNIVTNDGQWSYTHEPKDEMDKLRIKIATVRCARVSYKLPREEDKPFDLKKDLELYERLATSGHYSPFEHCGRVMTDHEYAMNISGDVGNYNPNTSSSIIPEATKGWSRNFHGFIQYREIVEAQTK